MNPGTLAAINAILQADPARNEADRQRLAEVCGMLAPVTPLPRVLRFRQAAELLGVSRRSLTNYVRRGTLREFKPAGALRALGFRDTDLRAFLAAGEVAR